MIKRYAQFISERLGVPEGNIEAARELLDIIAESLGEEASLFSEEGHSLTNRTYLDMRIGELLIESVEYEIVAHMHNMATKIPVLIGMAVSIPPSGREGDNILFDKNKLGKVSLKMIFAGRPDATMADAKSLIESDMPRYAGILSHELKHVYDKFMIGKELVGDVADYHAWSNIKVGIRPLDDAIYYMYAMSKTESMVRPSELAGEIKESRLKKSEFMEFLNHNNLYQTLKTIKGYSIEKLKKGMLESMDDIREVFEGIPDDARDEDIVDRMLDIAYREIVGHSVNVAEDILGLDRLAILLGKADKRDIESIGHHLRQRSFASGEKYFEAAIEEMSKKADEVMRKLAKLYDFCEDDSTNPLMAKISGK